MIYLLSQSMESNLIFALMIFASLSIWLIVNSGSFVSLCGKISHIWDFVADKGLDFIT